MCVYIYKHIIWLVVSTPLNNVGVTIPNIWEVIKHVPNHQPVIVLVNIKPILVPFVLQIWPLPPVLRFCVSVLRHFARARRHNLTGWGPVELAFSCRQKSG